MVGVDKKSLKLIEDELRDTINWVSVFDTEYDLPKEVVVKLKKKLQRIGKLLEIGTL